jgi:TolB-like protein/cytochrome c-type biogenesis protein CcmH/NrfG
LKAGEKPPSPASFGAPGKKRSRRNLAVAGLALLAVAVGLIAWTRPWAIYTHAHGEKSIATLDKPSIAVLPFTNMSGNEAEEYFADGMTDDLITDLSKISGLLVIARNSVFAFKGKAVNIPEVGRQLGVRYVLEGSVRRAGGRIRINAQLIAVETGHHLWAERYDREYSDIFTVQDEVIEKIVKAMAVRLTATEQQVLTRVPTTNLEAYDNYLRAEQYSYAGIDSVPIAMRLYEKAIQLDPEFAHAYASYARAAVDVWRFSYDQFLSNPIAKKLAYETASQALRLEPEHPRAYSVLGLLQMVDGEHKQAIASGRRAVLLGPSSADAHLTLGLILTYAGLVSEAIETVNMARRLEPRLSPRMLIVAGFIWFMDRQYQRALEAFERARIEMPENEVLSELLAISYVKLGRREDSARETAKLLAVFPPLSINHLRDQNSYFKRPEDLEHYLGALQEAGVPEWPFGFEGRPEDRLSAHAVKDIAFGRTWSGQVNQGTPFIQEIDERGTMAYRSANSFFTGEAFVDAGMLCIRTEVSLLGQDQCGFIYRNPQGSVENQDEYIYINEYSLMKFSAPD